MDTTSPRSSPLPEPVPGLADPVGGQKDLDVRHYLRVVLARKWFLIATFVLIVGGMAVHTYTQTPVYKASALVLIQPNEVQLLGNVKGIQDPIGEALSTQYQLIGSRRVAEKVWRDLKLEDSTSLGALAGGISVEPQRGSRLVRVGYMSPDPERAALVANTLVESYMKDNRERATGITDAGLKRLREKAAELRAGVQRAAEALGRFRTEHPELPIEGSQSLTSTRLTQLNSELITAESERIALRAEIDALRETGVDGADSDRFHELRLEVAKLSEQRSALLRRLKSEHPVVKELDGRLAEAQARLAQAHSTALRSLEARDRALEVRERRLRAEVEGLSQNMDQQSRDLVTHRFLMQEHEAVSKTHQDVERRISEIELAESTATSDMSVYWVERAEVPGRPVLPDVRKNLSSAAVLGLLAGIGLCFVIDYLDRSLKSKTDVEEHLRLPVLGFVPAILHKDQSRSIELQGATDARSHIAEAFRSIRTSVSFGVMNAGERGTRRVIVTSTLPRDGKTLVSVNLALAMSQTLKRVLLVDCDLRKPRVHKVFKLDNEVGLSSILAGEVPLDDWTSVVHDDELCPNLRVMTSGPMPPNPADLLNTERMAEFLRLLEGQFDWVVLDAPPSILADPVILSTHVRDVVFVVRSFVTPRDLARQACEQFAKVRSRVVGVVLNNASLPASAAGYTAYSDYGYGYGYGYRYRYRADDEPAGTREGSGTDAA